jgi:hypothetical protein
MKRLGRGGNVLELALDALHIMETSCTLHVAYLFVVVREALDQFGANLVGVHFVKFLGHHLLVSRCARVGGLGVVEGDGGNDEGVDITDRIGRNHWRAQQKKSVVNLLFNMKIKSYHYMLSHFC